MQVTQHTFIKRFGLFEYPVTITLDDGGIINEVLMFRGKPNESQINAAVELAVERYESREVSAPDELIFVSEVEDILRAKKMLGESETWINLKERPVQAVEQITEELIKKRN